MTPIAGDYLFNATYSGDSLYASQSGYMTLSLCASIR